MTDWTNWRTSRRALIALSPVLATGICLPASAQLGEQIATAPTRPATDDNGVDLIRGTLSLSQADLSIGIPGVSGLSYTRFWSENGWRDNLVATITSQGSGNVYTVSFGNTSDRFTWDGSQFIGTEAQGSKLVGNPDSSIYTSRDGVEVGFSRNYPDEDQFQANLARVLSINFPSGERLSFVWAEAIGCQTLVNANCYNQMSPYYRKRARLQAVVSSFGYQLLFSYMMDAQPYSAHQLSYNWRELTKITIFNKAVENCSEGVSYCTFTRPWPTISIERGTAAPGEYVTVTDSLSRTTRYLVEAGGARVSRIKRPGSTTDDMIISYDASNRVSGVYNRGVSWTYAYADAVNVRTTTVTGPSGQRVITADRTLERIVTDRNEAGFTTQYQYDASGRLIKVIAPEGNEVHYTYDGRGNVTQTRSVGKPESGAVDIITSATFDDTCSYTAKCNKPNTVTDARGGVTIYNYDTTHGGVTAVTSPALANGMRPQTRYTYAPLQAYYRNYTGAIVASGIPVQRVTQMSTCRTIESCVNSPDETRTSIAYGTPGIANNLLPTQSTQQSGDGLLSICGRPSGCKRFVEVLTGSRMLPSVRPVMQH